MEVLGALFERSCVDVHHAQLENSANDVTDTRVKTEPASGCEYFAMHDCDSEDEVLFLDDADCVHCTVHMLLVQKCMWFRNLLQFFSMLIRMFVFHCF